MILAGDIGGTKCNLALFAQHEVPLRPALQRRYATGDSGSLEQLIDQFFLECKTETGLTPAGKLTAAGFGVAGAVVDGRLVANNIPWELTAAGLANQLQLGLEQLVLINDLVATAVVRCGSPNRCAASNLAEALRLFGLGLQADSAEGARRTREAYRRRVTREKSVVFRRGWLLSLRCHRITMVQPAESRKGLNPAFSLRANFFGPTRWSVFREAEMCPVLVVIEQVRRHQPFEMPLIQDDHVVKQIVPTASHPALRNPVLVLRKKSVCT